MFSVVVPVYNKADFIATTIQSVLAQESADFELLVVDDGSTDGSVDVLAAVSDPRVRILRQANQGVGAARNAGIRSATRPWIAFLDADDLWAPNHLGSLKTAIQYFPETGFVSTRWAEVQETSPFEGCEPGHISDVVTKAVDFFEWSVHEPRYFHTSGVAIKRSILQRVGGFGLFQPGEDIELWVRVALETPVAVAMVTTDGRRHDARGLMSRARLHVPTAEIACDNLPTPVLRVLAARLDGGIPLGNRGSVERYFDFRLAVGVKAAVWRGDVRRAWKLWRLMRTRSMLDRVALFFPKRG